MHESCLKDIWGDLNYFFEYIMAKIKNGDSFWQDFCRGLLMKRMMGRYSGIVWLHVSATIW